MSEVGGILREFKQIEKSIADSVDKLGYVSPDKIDQFTDLTYTEVANFSFCLTRSRVLKEDDFPFVKTVQAYNPQAGKMEEKTVPLTYTYGQNLEYLVRAYEQLKISMGRKSRLEVQGVAKSFGGGVQQERQGILARVKGWIGGGK